MIKSYTVAVTEIDDADEAVRQAADGIASVPLMKNSMGIVVAHPEFVSSGIYGRIAGALPFPTIGTTAISHCARGLAETYMLSILILTSDDCAFSCVISEPSPAVEDIAGLARGNYEAARGALPDDPKFAVLYAPFVDKNRIGDYVSVLSGINGKLPIFGAVINDDHNSTAVMHSDARALYCGKAYEDRFALALVSGAVSPKFYIISVTEEAVIMPDVGVVTAADKNKLLAVNNVNAVEFFKSVGFLADETGSWDKGMLSSTFVLRVRGGDDDGVAISRIPTEIMEDGIMCGGRIVVGATISVAFNTRESVLETASQLMKTVKGGHSGGTAVIHSCIGRRYGLLNEPMRELEAIRDALDGGFSYIAAYASGEICPIAATENRARNLDHNQTLVACVF
jgi:hypothetical protein